MIATADALLYENVHYAVHCSLVLDLIVHASFINTAIHLQLKRYMVLLHCQHSSTFDILKAKTATLSDADFEKLMFMMENDDHVKTMELGAAGGQAIMLD